MGKLSWGANSLSKSFKSLNKYTKHARRYLYILKNALMVNLLKCDIYKA